MQVFGPEGEPTATLQPLEVGYSKRLSSRTTNGWGTERLATVVPVEGAFSPHRQRSFRSIQKNGLVRDAG